MGKQGCWAWSRIKAPSWLTCRCEQVNKREPWSRGRLKCKLVSLWLAAGSFPDSTCSMWCCGVSFQVSSHSVWPRAVGNNTLVFAKDNSAEPLQQQGGVGRGEGSMTSELVARPGGAAGTGARQRLPWCLLTHCTSGRFPTLSVPFSCHAWTHFGACHVEVPAGIKGKSEAVLKSQAPLVLCHRFMWIRLLQESFNYRTQTAPLGLPWWLSGVKNLLASAGDTGSIPGSGRSPVRGNGDPFQYSCLGNPMDIGAWQAIVHGVVKSQTRLSDKQQEATSSVGAAGRLESLLGDRNSNGSGNI